MRTLTQKNDNKPRTTSSAKESDDTPRTSSRRREHSTSTPPPSVSCAAEAAGRADSAILFLRLFIGTLLFTQAITKSQQYPWLEQEYPSLWGLSSADIVSLVGVIEAVAGALLAAGLLTRITSAVMTVVMIGAAFLLFPHQSFDQAELKVVYGGIYIFLLIAGAGRYSLDRLVCMVRKE